MYPKTDPNQQKQQPTRAKPNRWKHLNRKTKQTYQPIYLRLQSYRI